MLLGKVANGSSIIYEYNVIKMYEDLGSEIGAKVDILFKFYFFHLHCTNSRGRSEQLTLSEDLTKMFLRAVLGFDGGYNEYYFIIYKFMSGTDSNGYTAAYPVQKLRRDDEILISPNLDCFLELKNNQYVI